MKTLSERILIKLFGENNNETVIIENDTKMYNKSITSKPTITLKDIHNEFYNEVTQNLIDANNYIDTSNIISDDCEFSGKVLQKYGFSNEQTNDYNKKLIELAEKTNINLRNKALYELILNMQIKYPSYKFISQESVIKLCKKYGLSYGSVKIFKGNVPLKNIKQLEYFNISKEDIALCYSGSLVDGYIGTYRYKIINSGLMICAPIEMFDTTNHFGGNYIVHRFPEIDDLKLVMKDDPIVLQPVGIIYKSYKGYKHQTFGYLIVTAWGDEASDNLIVNEKMN